MKKREIVVIAVNDNRYLRRVVGTLCRYGNCPSLILLGSKAGRILFKYDSLARIWRQLGFIEIIQRLRRGQLLRSTYTDRYSKEELAMGWLTSLKGTRIEYFSHVNEASVILRLLAMKDIVVVLAGAGIVRNAFLAAIHGYCINGHPSILPGTRGVDVVYWDLIDGNRARMGVTAHLVVEKIDAGEIVRTEPVEIVAGESIGNFIHRLETVQAENLAEAAIELASKGAPRMYENPARESRFRRAAPHKVFLAGIAAFYDSVKSLGQ